MPHPQRLHRDGPGIGTSLALTLVLALTALGGNDVLRAWDDEPPEAEEILDRYVEVTGGRDAYDKITNRVARGTFEIPKQGIKASMVIVQAKPDKLYLRLESPSMGVTEKGSDGTVGWQKSLMTGTTLLDGQEKIDFLRDARLDWVASWRDVHESSEFAGEETVDDRVCLKVLFTPKGGSPRTFYYDKESGLLRKVKATIENPMGRIPVETHPMDYKEVDGVLLAHKTRVVVLGQERIMTMDKIEHNVEISPDRFHLPEEVRALLKKEEKKEKEGKEEKQKKREF